MSTTLFDLYKSTIKSWKPTICPDNFSNGQEIRAYQKSFEESYLQHMKTLEGTVVRERGKTDPNDIAIIDQVTPFFIHYESAPKQKDGSYHVSSTCPNNHTLKNTDVMETLTSEQEYRKKLILRRTEKRTEKH